MSQCKGYVDEDHKCWEILQPHSRVVGRAQRKTERQFAFELWTISKRKKKTSLEGNLEYVTTGGLRGLDVQFASALRARLHVNSLVELIVASVAVLGLVLLGKARVEGRRLDLRARRTERGEGLS
jgi:hypothetical protein